ncbi:hypothetical protein DIPPA_06240 [Diplonema papillatum]|nr:hypothetical protein DIPPA_06240 [Diplonema papillatum]
MFGVLVLSAAISVAPCDDVVVECGALHGDTLGPPVEADTLVACLSACTNRRLCAAAMYYAAEQACHLMASEYDGSALAVGDGLVANLGSIYSDECAPTLGATACDAVLHPICGSSNAAETRTANGIASVADCMAECVTDGCLSFAWEEQTSACKLYDATYSGSYSTTVVGLGSGFSSYVMDRPVDSAGTLVTTAQVDPPQVCAACVEVPVVYGAVVDPSLAGTVAFAPVWNLSTVAECVRECVRHSRCKGVEFHLPGDPSGNACLLLPRASADYPVDARVNFSVIVDRPSAATCVTISDASTVPDGDLPDRGADGACLAGWAYYAGTDNCYKYYGPGALLAAGDSLGTAPQGTAESYDTAAKWCSEMQATLPVIIDLTHNAFVVGLLPKGGTTWLGLKEDTTDPSVASGTLYRLPDGSEASFFAWHTGASYKGECVVLRSKADDGQTGGSDRWKQIACGFRHSWVCEMPANPVSFTNESRVNGTVATELVIGVENVVVLKGANLHSELWFTLQHSSSGEATSCTDVRGLSGVSQVVQISSIDAAGTEAVVVFPDSWPLTLGYKYSLCYADGRIYPSPTTPAQYQRHAAHLDLEAVPEYFDRKRAI